MTKSGLFFVLFLFFQCVIFYYYYWVVFVYRVKSGLSAFNFLRRPNAKYLLKSEKHLCFALLMFRTAV